MPRAGHVGAGAAIAKVSAPIERGAKAAVAPVSPARSVSRAAQARSETGSGTPQAHQGYKATLAIMKKHGVKGLARRTAKSGRAPKAAARPLQVFAEGDSWFDYPVPMFGGGIIRGSKTRWACRS